MGRRIEHEQADVIGALNPDGLMVRVIGSRRWALGGEQPGPLSPFFQGGLMLAATPAYAKGALQLEWLPHPALQLGPFYEIARAGAAAIVQQRAGLIAAWTVADAYGPLRRPGFGIEAGFHPGDPNRQREPYVLLGIETYSDLDETIAEKGA